LLSVTNISGHDPRPRTGKLFGIFAAKTACRTGDDDDFTLHLMASVFLQL
jgi:hypothetical protein